MSAFLKALEEASEADLKQLDDRLAELTREQESLRAARRVLGVKLGKVAGKKPGPAKKATPGPAGEGVVQGSKGGSKTEEYRIKVGEYLVKVRQAVAPMRLVEELGIPQGSITGVLDSPLFERSSQGVHLTTMGRQKFG